MDLSQLVFSGMSLSADELDWQELLCYLMTV